MEWVPLNGELKDLAYYMFVLEYDKILFFLFLELFLTGILITTKVSSIRLV